MKIQKTLLIASMGLILATSCKKNKAVEPVEPETPTTTVTPTGDAAALSNYFTNNVNNYKQNFTIDASSTQSITGTDGTVVTFYANSFQTLSGGAVSGNIDIELIEAYSKSDMILLNKPTVAFSTGGTDYAPLISGGEFNIEVSQNGQELTLKPGWTYNASVQAPNGVDPNMDLFYGVSQNDTIIWEQSDSSQIFGQGNAYDCYFDSINWINCDYFYSNPGPQTNVEVEIPAGFTNQTCMVFVSFDGLNSITSFYNYSNGVYSSGPSYQLPVGLEVHFVAVSFIGGNPHVSIVPATITNGHHEVLPALVQTTEAQFEADLVALP
jgi:hypothetical protein